MDQLLLETHQRGADGALAIFCEDMKRQFRSYGDFLIADLNGDATRVEQAANVLTWHKNRFATVRQLVDQCGNHGWNFMIEEAWLWEAGNQAYSLIKSLDATAARAATIYAEHAGYVKVGADGKRINLMVGYDEMQDAIDEARRALEGDDDY